MAVGDRHFRETNLRGTLKALGWRVFGYVDSDGFSAHIHGQIYLIPRDPQVGSHCKVGLGVL